MSAPCDDRQPVAHLIDDARELQVFLARAAAAWHVAVDVEADGMFRYRARLCTVQLAVADGIAIVDTLALPDTGLLRPLLGAEGPEKIVHDASFDARMLYAAGMPLGRVFDTAVAARFLGVQSTGLSNLLAARFDVVLEKSHQHADWGQRPIRAPLLRYLEDDVRYLAPLYGSLLDDVRARDIEAEVREECAYVLTQAQVVSPGMAPWMRLKGAGQLLPSQRARLRALCEERERLACALDVPPGRLLSNDLLLRLAVHPSLNEASLCRALGASAAVHLEALLGCVLEAAKFTDAPLEEVNALCPPAPNLAHLERRKRRRKLLTEFRAREAAARGVDLQVVLPGHCLTDLAELATLDRGALAELPGFGACRVERYADVLASQLAERW